MGTFLEPQRLCSPLYSLAYVRFWVFRKRNFGLEIQCETSNGAAGPAKIYQGRMIRRLAKPGLPLKQNNVTVEEGSDHQKFSADGGSRRCRALSSWPDGRIRVGESYAGDPTREALVTVECPLKQTARWSGQRSLPSERPLMRERCITTRW